ncbi:MAG: T9SS type A sorting domain-containing protein [Candidatus Limisoma sp.]
MNKILYITLVTAFGASAVSPVHNRVVDYSPAPGQFINLLPEWEEGDDAKAMAAKALQAMTVDESIISLGGWGGSVTVGFERTIVNVPGKRDIYIEGNSFSNGTANAGSAEPGVVWVAYDINGNGEPDDNEWFEIAGSEYANSRHNYRATYTRPASTSEAIPWVDNYGGSGAIERLTFHKQDYWPQWVDASTLTFDGIRLPDNSENQGTESEPYYVLTAFDYGYADNQPNLDDSGNYNEGAKIDIDWAIDRDGNAVHMPGVDFVRIYTGVNQFNGWIGECSTEVGRVMNAHTVRQGNTEVVDESIAVDRKVLADFLDKYGENGGAETLTTDDVRIYLTPSGVLRFTLVSPAVLNVYDSLGARRLSQRFGAGAQEVDLSSLPGGVYVVAVGKQTQKIMVNKR